MQKWFLEILNSLMVKKWTFYQIPKYSDTWKKKCWNDPKIWIMRLYQRVMRPKDTDRLGAVWSESTLFAQDYLSENLGSLL